VKRAFILPIRQQAIAAEKGFIITDHCLHLYGICADCQRAKPKE
jgi:Fe2+ or Zn2+ uptake regulation protein